jgi:hypothetical protein
VQFQQPLRPELNPARRVAPWGQSGRQIAFARFPSTEPVLIGDLNANRVLQEGGVAALPMFWQVNVSEVIRTAALAIRRRSELLGPLSEHDRISKDLAAAFARGNLSVSNHWSSAWVDLLRGVSAAGIGKLDEADKLLGRAIVVDGQFDHPLTCVALLEQGRVAMGRGNSPLAAKLLAEASFSAYYFENWDVVTESLWLGWLNHLSSGSGGVYPPLEIAAAWAQTNRLQHIAVKLRLAQAESLASMGELDAAAALVDDAVRRMGEMRTGLAGVQALLLQAILQLARGDTPHGCDTLAKALDAQQSVSVRNFRVARTNEMFDAGAISPRIAVDLYPTLLADPAPVDWFHAPLDSMAVLQAPHDAAFDRWLVAALERKDVALAIEAIEQAKRRRFLATQPFGGRLAALRSILEAPETVLSQEALLQRQQILTNFPGYRALIDAGQAIHDKLRAGPILPVDSAEAKPLATLYNDWEKNVNQRRQMLAELAPRRLASAIEFPPLRTLPELQKTLAEGEALLMFHAAANSLYGFVATQTDVHYWTVGDPRRMRNAIGEFLRAMGNYGPNRPLPVADLQSSDWRKSAVSTFEAIFADVPLDWDKTTALRIVPDDVLWYLPFEALVPSAPKEAAVLGDRIVVRYAPTASLAVAQGTPLRRPQRVGIVANELAADKDLNGEELIKSLEKVVTGPMRLPLPLPEPGHLVAPLLDGLIALDDIDLRPGAAWSPLPRSRNTADAAAPVDLPYGGPEHIVVAGFSTAAEQGLKASRRSASRRGRPGEEVFRSLCDMVADGARTILLSRWRTGGRTNFELVREYVRELPQSTAAEAWQRSCLLARESPIEPALEPRLKRTGETAGDLPTADHPFFWAGYLLVDTAPKRNGNNGEPDQPADQAKEAPKDSKLPPPGEPIQPKVEDPGVD